MKDGRRKNIVKYLARQRATDGDVETAGAEKGRINQVRSRCGRQHP